MIPTGQFELQPVKLGQHGPFAMRDVIMQTSRQAADLAAATGTATKVEKEYSNMTHSGQSELAAANHKAVRELVTVERLT